MFRNLSMGRKISIGFAAVIVPMLVVAGVGYQSMHAADAGFQEYRGLARDTNLAGRLQAEMLMVRMSVKDYLLTHTEEDLKHFQEYWDKTRGLLDTAQQEIKDPQRAALVDEIDEQLQRYETAFREIIGHTAVYDDMYAVLSEQGGVLLDATTTALEHFAQVDNAPALQHCANARATLLKARLTVMKFMKDRTRENQQLVEGEFRILAEQHQLIDGAANGQQSDVIATLHSARQRYVEGFGKLASAALTMNDITHNKLDKLGPAIAAKAEDVKLSVKEDQDALGPALQAANQRSTMIVLTISGAALIVGIVVSVILTRILVKPVRAAAEMLKDIAQGEGDLTKRLVVSTKDEVGQMAGWFNTFVEKLQGIIGQIADNAKTIASSATELTSTAQQLASGAEQTTNQSSTVASAAEEMSTNMSNMASSTEQMSANVKTVAAAIEEMTASIADVARNAEQAAGVADNAAQLAHSSNESMGTLDSAAAEIGKVIETIQDIAEQTNLLALNATIEAARAGDAGKGFAVVATEVKELAKQSAQATEDIRHRIEAIQSSTGTAVRSIGEIGSVIQQVNEVSRTIASSTDQQTTATREISQNIAQTASAADLVSTGVAESAAASQEITQNIVGVDTAARQSAEGANQTRAAGEELSRLGERLRELVGQFRY